MPLNEIILLGRDVPHEDVEQLEISPHVLLQEIYDAIVAEIDNHGPQSTRYVELCKTYGDRLLSYWALKIARTKRGGTLRIQDPHETQMDVEKLEHTKEWDEQSNNSGSSYLRLVEGNFSMFADSPQVTRTDIFMRSDYHTEGKPYIIDDFKARVLNGVIDQIQAPEITSNRRSVCNWSSEGDVFFRVVLRDCGINTITRTQILSGDVSDSRTVRRHQSYGTT